MSVVLQVELYNSFFNKSRNMSGRNTFDSSVIEHVFFYRHFIEDGVGLWTVADVFAHLAEVLENVDVVDLD